MNQTFYDCNLKYIALVAKSALGGGSYIVVDTQGFDTGFVSGTLRAGSWSTAVVGIKKGNNAGGPFFDFASALSLTSSTKSSEQIPLDARYLALAITTGEGSDNNVDFSIALTKRN